MLELTQKAPSLPLDMQRHLPKHVRLKFILQERLKQLQSGDKLPSIAALQAEFGIAQGTVTRVLRELQADGLVEARYGSGVFATGRVHLKTIAICMGFDALAPQAGAFPQLLLKGLEAAAGKFKDIQCRHYLFSTDTIEGWHNHVCALEQDVRRHLVDGFIVMGFDGRELGDLQAPVVALHVLPYVRHSVELDFDALIRNAMTTLKARNCRRVALLGPAFAVEPPPGTYHDEVARRIRRRMEFFRAEVARRRMVTRDEWNCRVVLGPSSAQAVSAAARAYKRAWQAAPEKPDSLICLDDYMATGAIQAMRELGLEPGRDVQVVTHANRGSDVLSGLPVTTVEFDPVDVARALLETTHKLISGIRVPAMVLVPPVLVV